MAKKSLSFKELLAQREKSSQDRVYTVASILDNAIVDLLQGATRPTQVLRAKPLVVTIDNLAVIEALTTAHWGLVLIELRARYTARGWKTFKMLQQDSGKSLKVYLAVD